MFGNRDLNDKNSQIDDTLALYIYTHAHTHTRWFCLSFFLSYFLRLFFYFEFLRSVFLLGRQARGEASVQRPESWSLWDWPDRRPSVWSRYEWMNECVSVWVCEWVSEWVSEVHLFQIRTAFAITVRLTQGGTSSAESAHGCVFIEIKSSREKYEWRLNKYIYIYIYIYILWWRSNTVHTCINSALRWHNS